MQSVKAAVSREVYPVSKTYAIRHLLTEAGEKLSGQPWTVYPRPHMKRSEWICLNGIWDFAAIEDETIQPDYSQTILVPFCPESRLSGVNRVFPIGTTFCYRKHFEIPSEWAEKHILLHFGAVDQECIVFLDGIELMRHSGGYYPFQLDITEYVCGKPVEHTLEVRVKDDLRHDLPWGKQSRSRGGMWYTPFSGIWQTVWMEPVPEYHIDEVSVQLNGCTAEITVEGVPQAEIDFNGGVYAAQQGRVRITVPEPRLWSPEDPFLYMFTVLAGEDRVESYFAIRTLTIGNVNGIPRLCLNGSPYFFNGLLDQGYWSDGICLPASPMSYEQDISAMKALGYNTLRKHIKVEPELFYYACDRLGMIVFQDMVNCGDYHYIRDSVLPTLGMVRRRDEKLNSNRNVRSAFLQHMKETVGLLRSHPCICYWTIFNEGWGQFQADEAYDYLRQLDPSRWIDSTSGWFHQRKSDVDSLHIYFSGLHLGKRTDLPQVLSEFGGFSFKLAEHSANLKETYGYRKYTDSESYVKAMQEIYGEIVRLARKGLCAAIYTQISDVEDETNGILTYDRKVCRLQPEHLREIAHQLQEAVSSNETCGL